MQQTDLEKIKKQAEYGIAVCKEGWIKNAEYAFEAILSIVKKISEED